jgi:hypothetical protein
MKSKIKKLKMIMKKIMMQNVFNFLKTKKKSIAILIITIIIMNKNKINNVTNMKRADH